MHEVKVQVVRAELLQGVLDGELDVLRVVVDLKELGSDEELFTGDTGILDTLSNLAFVLVTPSAAVYQYNAPWKIARPAIGSDGARSQLTRCACNRPDRQFRLETSRTKVLTLIAASTALETSPGLSDQS